MAELFESRIGPEWARLNLVEAYRRSKHPSRKLAGRVLDLFQWHSILPTQIQRFIPALTLDLIGEPERLLPALNNEVLDQITDLFGVRREWIEGSDERVYTSLSCCQMPEIFLNKVAELAADPRHLELRAYTAHEELSFRGPRYQFLCIVFVQVIAELGDEDIVRYFPLTERWDWSYPQSRIQLKAMVRIAHLKHRLQVRIHRTTAEVVAMLEDGKMVPPHDCAHRLECQLEDFCLKPEESMQASELDELDAALRAAERLEGR